MKFFIGERVFCSESGVIGDIIKFYKPTASEEQIMVKTLDGREYHAPVSMWKPYGYGFSLNFSPTGSILNPFEKQNDDLAKIIYNVGQILLKGGKEMKNLQREVWEGWTPQDFIDRLSKA